MLAVASGTADGPACLDERGSEHASRPVPGQVRQLPDLLGRAGYHVGFTGKPWSPGDLGPGRKGNPVGPAFNSHKLTPPLSGIKDNDYTANFAEFLKKRTPGAPFCFWYGAVEPHRGYERGSGLKAGKKLEDVMVPGFLPDTPAVRQRLPRLLRRDRMVRPAARPDARPAGKGGRTGEHAGHRHRRRRHADAPGEGDMLRIRPACADADGVAEASPGRTVVEDPIGFVDLNATILAAAQVEHPAKNNPALAPSERDFLPLLTSPKQGL